MSDERCDPIGDIREFAAAVYLERSLTPFERVVVRSGLSTGLEFPRLPVRWRPLGPGGPPSEFGVIHDAEEDR